ncbi:hypothetical protein BC833DRAFT_101851 [Globomyces pollinis-pini]|nr:hypothetical protein BC833DRAFT_101851 [Globomyces pollinis-pini]
MHTVLSDNQIVQVSKQNINQAETTYIWISTIPEMQQVPLRNELSSILTHFCKSFYFICVFSILVYAAVKYHKLHVRAWLFVLLLQVLRIFVLGANLSYYYIVFPNELSMHISGWVYYSLLGIETLATIAYTFHQINSFLQKKPTYIQMIALSVVVMALHIGFYGGLYFIVCFAPGSICKSFAPTVKIWVRYRSYWFILVFILNFLPVQIIAFVVVMNLSYLGKFRPRVFITMFSIDKTFTALTIVQVIIIGLYFTVNYIQLHTILSGDDMTYLLLGHIRTALVGFHEILNIWLTSRLRVLFQTQSKIGKQATFKTTERKSTAIEKSHSTRL